MSAVAPPRPVTSAGPDPADRPEPGRLAQWRSTWAVALRMARRDVRRHRGRSALVVVMVVLPTLLLSTVVTLAYTSEVSGTERIPSAMGSGQAFLEWPGTQRMRQLPEPSLGTEETNQQAEPVPGFDREASAFANADAVARLVGADVAPLERYVVRTTVDERRVTLDGLALDGSRGLGEKLSLESGRWPAPPPADGTRPVEALVTPSALNRGLPASGTVEVTVDGTTRTLTVVGVGRGADTWTSPGIVTAAPITPTVSVGGGGWVVLGDEPVLWADVERLGDHGFRVLSAAVLRDPPADAELPESLRQASVGDGQRTGLMVGLAAAMLLISTTLLVGPAFAVSATRQRRTLALAASNGASTPVLRRTVLAQAIVLGAASAVVGVALGVLVAWGVTLATADAQYPPFAGPFDVRLGTLGAVAACATASTLVAALVPARRLGRLDIVGVMRGQSVSPPPSVAVLVVGVFLSLVGAALTLAGTGVVEIGDLAPTVATATGGSAEVLVVVGAVVLIVGSLLLVPMVLAATGRLGGALPTSLRMAARDLARHRSRSAPSVAAVLAAVAGLTFGLTGLASDTEQNRRQYSPVTLPGEMTVHGGYGQPLTTDEVRAAAPGLVVTPTPVVATDPTVDSTEPPTGPYRVGFVTVVPDGCTPEQTLAWVSADDTNQRCWVAGTQSPGSGEVLVLPADELLRRLDLSAEDAAAVRAGAAVAYGLTGETARVARGSYVVDPTATEEPVDPDVVVEQDATVPLVALPRTVDSVARLLGATLAVAESDTTRDWETVTTRWTVRSPDGSAVSERAAEQAQLTLGDEVYVQVERGFQRDDRVVVAVLLGVFALLILVVTLTSTALTLAEQQTDQATLAALGATRGTRRVMAAAQAFLLSAVGCVLGVAVGLVPGIAISRPLTSTGWDPVTFESIESASILVVPWADLAVVGVLVPVLAAALAAAGIRRAPQVTRRAT